MQTVQHIIVSVKAFKSFRALLFIFLIVERQKYELLFNEEQNKFHTIF
jgi:hypothetical protein